MEKTLVYTNDISDEKFKEMLRDYMTDEEVSAMSYDELYDRMTEYLDNEYAQVCEDLDCQFDMPILVVADLGLWNGRQKGSALIRSGRLSDCFRTNCDCATWYVDGRKNLCCDASHHDGNNHYLYRVFKPRVSNTQIENLQYKIAEGAATSADISRLTSRVCDCRDLWFLKAIRLILCRRSAQIKKEKI